jgi:hypothetical protein
MEQVDLVLCIYHVGTEITPYTCCENFIDPDSKPCCYVAFPEKNKNNNYYTEYTRFRKSYNIRLQNRIPLAFE